MSNNTASVSDAPTNHPSKAQTVTKLLSRKAGATLANLTDATGWQPHSARAHLTGLRKKGAVILREKRKDGTTCWRITSVAPSAPKVEA
jgi:predicted ArsR family transcriptional regulator